MRKGGLSRRTGDIEGVPYRPPLVCGRVLSLAGALLLFLSGCSGQVEPPAMATRGDCEELRAIEARLTVASAMPARPTAATAAELLRHQENLSAMGGADAASGVKAGSAGGDRAGKAFTAKGKSEIDAENAGRHGGTNMCENCSTEVVPGQKSQKGVSPPNNERHRDHILPKSKGGNGDPSNGQVLCRGCNLKKGVTAQ